jgi:hypothetical protein
MTGLIMNGPMLLKWNCTHDANLVTALETMRSASHTVPAAQLLPMAQEQRLVQNL